MKDFLEEVGKHRLTRALDVAGGDGRFSVDFLIKKYEKVDLFDQCPIGYGKAKQAMKYKRGAGDVKEASMQNYRWDNKYTGVYMIWCAGYLSETLLKKFLERAKRHLRNDGKRTSRREAPDCFIFVLDNVLEDGEESYFLKTQRLRTQAQFETIFSWAGLVVHKRSERMSVGDDFMKVMLWALY